MHMNRQIITYMLRDAREGISRNLGAALAAAALIFVAMLISGVLLLLRSGIGDMMDYLESQVTMKVYVDPATETQAIAKILENKSFVRCIEVETKEQMLERLSLFFTGREHLLLSFQESEYPDAIRLELADKSNMKLLAAELGAVLGIMKVVYPQEYAEMLVKSSAIMQQSGMMVLVFFLVIAFGMVLIAMNLALYQRQKEIRVKLLLGANPKQVRGQFLFEGALIGLVGSLLASLMVHLFFSQLLLPLQSQFPSIFQLSIQLVYEMMVGIALIGSCLGLTASYVSTRKLIHHA